VGNLLLINGYMLRNKLAPKHQKLIRQCYPSGRGIEKRPNASELSYLLYYVSTRRIKLNKVASFLEKSIKSDVYRERTGNVHVTLDITDALIERCHEDLNLFAFSVVNIISTVLTMSNDIALGQSATKVFATFCRHHDGGLFSGEPAYVAAFHALVAKYVDIAATTSTTGSLQWKQIGIEAANSVASSPALTTQTGQAEIAVILPLILSTLSLDEDGAYLLELGMQAESKYADTHRRSIISEVALPAIPEPNFHHVPVNVSDESEPKHVPPPTFRISFDQSEHTEESTTEGDDELIRLTTTNMPADPVNPAYHRMSVSQPKQRNEDTNSTTSQESEVLETAFQALMHLFDTTVAIQIRRATYSVVEFVLESPSPPLWSTILVEQITKRTPVQLRFIILSSLVDKFVALGFYNLSEQLFLCQLVCSLLSSSVNMIGLSVMDVLRALLSHQHRILTYSSTEPVVKNIILAARDSISSLAIHVYYADQISDMVSELLSKCCAGSATLASSRNSSGSNQPTNGHHHQPQTTLIINDLQNVREILATSRSIQRKGEISKVPLSVWEGTQSLLGHESLLVASEYVSTFVTYLESGLSGIEALVVVPKSLNADQMALTRMAQNAFNIALETSTSYISYVAVYHFVSALITNLKLYSVVKLMPHVWGLYENGIEAEHRISRKYSPEQGVGMSSMALALLATIASTLNLLQMGSTVENEIRDRRKRRLWYVALDVPLEQGLLQTEAIGSIDASATAQTTALDSTTLLNQFEVKLPHEVKAALFHTEPPESEPDNSLFVPPLQVSKPRSLRQLKGAALSANYSSTSINSDFYRRQLPVPFTRPDNASCTDPRRDFSPRVMDLKRAVSGAMSERSKPVRSNSVVSRSTFSGRSALSQFDREPEFDARVDLDTFLNDLNLSDSYERGRLTR
jgi:hypothetical protein